MCWYLLYKCVASESLDAKLDKKRNKEFKTMLEYSQQPAEMNATLLHSTPFLYPKLCLAFAAIGGMQVASWNYPRRTLSPKAAVLQHCMPKSEVN